VEDIRTIYGSDLIPTSSDIEIDVDVLEAEKIDFTLVTNKEYKRKSIASFLSFVSLGARHCSFHRLLLFSKL